MIQRQTATVHNVPRTAAPADHGALRFGAYWRRLSQGWSRAMNPCGMEQRIEREVRFQLRRRPEPGDAAIVNRIVEEFSR